MALSFAAADCCDPGGLLTEIQTFASKLPTISRVKNANETPMM